MPHVIIPSAKIVGEELQKLGKLPAIIYPINQRIVFDYLFEQYQKTARSINILCYESASEVHQRLANYKSDLIHIFDLPELKDLGHTIYSGLQALQGKSSVIINFADTIVMEDLSHLPSDSFYYAKDYLSEKWTFFKMRDGKVTTLFDKTFTKKNAIGKKENLFVGVFHFSDVALLKRCLEYAFDHPLATISSFYQAIQLYSSHKKLQPISTEKWFDIGHADRYYQSTLEVKARTFNHIEIDKNRGILRKTSEAVDKFLGEIKWYLKLPSDIDYVRPRIFDYSTAYRNPYVCMEYYDYHTLHELFLYGELTKNQWADIFSKIAFVCKEFGKYSVRDADIKASCEDIYLTKTIVRLNQLRSNKNFSKFFSLPIQINGKKYKSLEEIINTLKYVIPKHLYDVDRFTIIHGDLCFANIMIDSNFSFVKVIDPRGKFGKFDIYGDPRYELAKLFHSVDGKYDFIIKDLFEISFDCENPRIDFCISYNREENLYDIFLEAFKEEIGKDRKKIELIESVLFLSMIPLHTESLSQQMAMLATGIEILNRVVKITL